MWANISTQIHDTLMKVPDYLPTLVGALIILIVGWIVSKIVRRLADWLLSAIRFDTMSEKAGITEVLRKGSVKYTPRELICGISYWLLMITTWVLTIDALGIPKAENILSALFTYVPRMVVALFVFVIGLFIAAFVAGIVRTAMRNTNTPRSELVSDISRWAIIAVSTIIALEALGIGTVLVSTFFNIILICVAGLVLALALAFGLGGRDSAAKYLNDLQVKHANRKGTHSRTGHEYSVR